MNLIKIYSYYPPVPVFGIDKVLSFFVNLVPEEDWKRLEDSCLNCEEKNCLNYCKQNPFLLNIEFEKIKTRNYNEAKSYIKEFKTGAFFSGMIPGIDIGMEYLYRYKFKKRLKSLYGFDYEKAEKIAKKHSTNVENEEKKNLLEGINDINENEIIECTLDEKKKNIEKNKKNIENKIDDGVTSGFKNTSSIIRGAFEIGSGFVKALPSIGRFIVSSTLKTVSWSLLPISCIGFGYWSKEKIDEDCNEILKIFEEAFTPLKFETLLSYIKSIRLAIINLEYIGKQLIKDDEEKKVI